MFDYNIWLTLFLSTEVFWSWPRELNRPSKFSTTDDFYFGGGHLSRHMALEAFTRSFHTHLALGQLLLLCTSSQKPQPTLSISTLFPKTNLTMYLPHGFICASLGSRRPKDFGNQIRINLEVRRTRAFVFVHPPLTPHMTGASATLVTAGVVQFLTLSPSSDQHQISPCNSNAL